MKTFTLPFTNTMNMLSQKDLDKMCKYDNLKGCPSFSQMLKRMPQEMFEQIINMLENGEEVTITGK